MWVRNGEGGMGCRRRRAKLTGDEGKGAEKRKQADSSKRTNGDGGGGGDRMGADRRREQSRRRRTLLSFLTREFGEKRVEGSQERKGRTAVERTNESVTVTHGCKVVWRVQGDRTEGSRQSARRLCSRTRVAVSRSPRPLALPTRGSVEQKQTRNGQSALHNATNAVG